jgi:type I restriction enzyme R subunit
VLQEEREGEAPVSPSDLKWLKGLTIQLVDHIKAEVSIVDFWKNAHAQEELRGQIFEFLDCKDVVSFERADAVADRLMELAKANQARLVDA